MALTRNFRETVQQRARDDAAFRVGLLTEAAECFINGEVDEAKTLLRDYINATIGFQELGRITRKKPASLMRMLSDKGKIARKAILAKGVAAYMLSEKGL